MSMCSLMLAILLKLPKPEILILYVLDLKFCSKQWLFLYCMAMKAHVKQYYFRIVQIPNNLRHDRTWLQ